MKTYLMYFAILSSLTLKSCGNDAEKKEENEEKVKMKLYHHPLSPSSRAVVILLKILGLPYVSEEINVLAGDNLREEYLRMNPQHTIPVLIDDGHVVVDSHAINMYLMNEYGTRDNESWYPTSSKARSLVDHRLHFDTGFLSNFITSVVRDFNFNDKIDGVTREMVRLLENIYTVVEKFLTVHRFIAGNELTIADISAMTSLSSLEIIWRPDPERFPLLKSYMGTCKAQIPHFDKINGPAVIEMWKKMTLENFKFQIDDDTDSGPRG